jgi:dTDP-4-dehydrorhamnose 3,5-epimerase
MRFHSTTLDGPRLVEMRRIGDHRGFLARMFCEKTFAEAGLQDRFVQINNSVSRRRGTLRGLHYQAPPHAEAKLLRVVSGAVFNVAVDVRRGSPTFGQWFGAELDADRRMMMYTPQGFAHGCVSLTDDAEFIYLTSAFYAPAAERGVRFDDPRVGIAWPIPVTEVSDKDRAWPDLDPAVHAVDIDAAP